MNEAWDKVKEWWGIASGYFNYGAEKVVGRLTWNSAKINLYNRLFRINDPYTSKDFGIDERSICDRQMQGNKYPQWQGYLKTDKGISFFQILGFLFFWPHVVANLYNPNEHKDSFLSKKAYELLNSKWVIGAGVILGLIITLYSWLPLVLCVGVANFKALLSSIQFVYGLTVTPMQEARTIVQGMEKGVDGQDVLKYYVPFVPMDEEEMKCFYPDNRLSNDEKKAVAAKIKDLGLKQIEVQETNPQNGARELYIEKSADELGFFQKYFFTKAYYAVADNPKVVEAKAPEPKKQGSQPVHSQSTSSDSPDNPGKQSKKDRRKAAEDRRNERLKRPRELDALDQSEQNGSQAEPLIQSGDGRGGPGSGGGEG